MAVALNHVNIRARDLEATVAFYVDAVGLTVGARPPFGFPGAWLYDGEKAVVHLIVSDAGVESAESVVDHVAFAYDALDPALRRLDALGLSYTTPRFVPGTEIRQSFTKDSNGVTVELQGP